MSVLDGERGARRLGAALPLALVASLGAALAIIVSLADFFRASGEFSLIVGSVAAFCVFAALVLGTALHMRPAMTTLNAVAAAMAVVALLPLVLPGLVQAYAERSTNPFSIGIENTYITIELIMPALAAVLVQWGVLRNHLRRSAGPGGVPWFAIALAGLVALNPFGLALLASAWKRSPTDWLWQLSLTIVTIAVAILVVIALIECYIRRRKRRRAAELRNTET